MSKALNSDFGKKVQKFKGNPDNRGHAHDFYSAVARGEKEEKLQCNEAFNRHWSEVFGSKMVKPKDAYGKLREVHQKNVDYMKNLKGDDLVSVIEKIDKRRARETPAPIMSRFDAITKALGRSNTKQALKEQIHTLNGKNQKKDKDLRGKTQTINSNKKAISKLEQSNSNKDRTIEIMKGMLKKAGVCDKEVARAIKSRSSKMKRKLSKTDVGADKGSKKRSTTSASSSGPSPLDTIHG